MNGNKKTFKKTGRNVTVSKEDLTNVMIERLMNYDSMSPSERKSAKNPYTDPVFTKVAGGKMVQVPRGLQNQAIVQWESMKRRADLSDSQEPRSAQDVHDALMTQQDARMSQDLATQYPQSSFKMQGPQSSFKTQGPHTRLSKKSRYVVRDPYVMNRELNIEGAQSNVFENDPDNLDLINMDINGYKQDRAVRRREVGSLNIPDTRYGRGGSYGDFSRNIDNYPPMMSRNDKSLNGLPRTTDDVVQRMARDIQDMPYDTPSAKGHVMPFEGQYLYARDMPESSHAYLDEQLVRSRRATRVAKVNKNVDTLTGDDHEVLAEDNTAETNGVEHYAPVNDNELSENRDPEVMDYPMNDCVSCRGGDDGYIYKDQHQSQEEQMYADEEAEYDNDMSGQDYVELDEDEPTTDDQTADGEKIENYCGESSDCTYKYMFFLLLLFVLAFVIYKKKNGESV